MSAALPCPLALPLLIIQEPKWPFDINVDDANGHPVMTWRRFEHSTRDTLAKVNQRPHNIEQLAKLQFIVDAVNATAGEKSA